MANKLTDLGFAKGINNEAIVTTLNSNGTPNAAPMGIEMQDEQHLKLSIFNTSSTCQNLKTKKQAVINLTNNAEIYYKTTFKETNPTGQLPQNWFTPSKVFETPRLQSANATIEIYVNFISENAERTVFTCKVKHINTKQTIPQIYCRAMPLTIEAIIHATRVNAFMGNPEKNEQVTELIKTIHNNAHIIEHVAPNSQYSIILNDLLKRIDSWRYTP